MSIAHNFMSILIHRAGFMSIARYEFYDNIGSMYELCSYYDGGFIMNELCSYISCMTFIMIPMLDQPRFWRRWSSATWKESDESCTPESSCIFSNVGLSRLAGVRCNAWTSAARYFLKIQIIDFENCVIYPVIRKIFLPSTILLLPKQRLCYSPLLILYH